ncbi:MAG: hypothetical protein FWE45_05260 [Firmicutes bacterium]|nr:hypothetical protein [Bacillota bacterium]
MQTATIDRTTAHRKIIFSEQFIKELDMLDHTYATGQDYEALTSQVRLGRMIFTFGYQKSPRIENRSYFHGSAQPIIGIKENGIYEHELSGHEHTIADGSVKGFAEKFIKRTLSLEDSRHMLAKLNPSIVFRHPHHTPEQISQWADKVDFLHSKTGDQPYENIEPMISRLSKLNLTHEQLDELVKERT